MAVDLSTLPPAQAIEELSYEDILASIKADLIVRYPEIEPILQLESTVVAKVLEVAAYQKTLLRARINDAVRANILAAATGADLENLAAFYGVSRLAGESDARLRDRVVLAVLGRAPGGTEEWYAYHAMTADADVAEVKVYRIDTGPRIGVSVLSAVNGGVPDQAMLDAVEAVVNSKSVRSVNDVISVSAATSQTADIVADVWLLPNTPHSVFTGLEAQLRAAWQDESGIGFDLNRSWVEAKLHVSGVSKVNVTAPAADAVASDTSAIAIGTVTLNFKGVSR